MNYDKETIGKRILAERTRLKLTQAGLGRKINTTGKQICNYEKGITTPPIDTMFALCKTFNCELGYLLGEEDYSDKTKFVTAITKETGLDFDTLENLQRVALGFFGDYKHTLNTLLSSSQFQSFIMALKSLDDAIRNYESPMRKLEESYDIQVIREAVEIEKSIIDYEYDPSAPEIRPEVKEAIKELRAAIDEQVGYSYTIKIARYELYQRFEQMIEELCPHKIDS